MLDTPMYALWLGFVQPYRTGSGHWINPELLRLVARLGATAARSDPTPRLHQNAGWAPRIRPVRPLSGSPATPPLLCVAAARRSTTRRLPALRPRFRCA